MPVGTAMTIEASVKKARGAKPRPAVNMWCAHTAKPMTPIDDHRTRPCRDSRTPASGEGRDDLADHPKGRQDHDVDLGVPEEPEEVHEQHRIAAAGRIEEGRAEIAVGRAASPARRRAPGCAITSRNAVIRIDQTNSGSIEHAPCPGARRLKMVVMKLIAPRIEEMPAMWSARIAMSTDGPGCPPMPESGG